MTLGSYLEWAMRQPWGWGSAPGLDCCKFAAQFVVTRGFIDPMVLVFRHPYDTKAGALRRIVEGGGLLTLWREGMAHVGAEEADDLQPGYVGVISRPTCCGLNESAGIWTGERWATLGMRGLDLGPAEPLGVWRV